MADINEVSLNSVPEEVGEIDWDAPESGAYPPRVWPGTYPFIFHLPEDQDKQFDAIQIKDQPSPTLQVNFSCEIPKHELNGRWVGEEPVDESVTILFQRVSFYKSPKMPISMGADLLRNLGLRVEGAVTKTSIIDAFRSADGRARGKAEFGWRAYCKTCNREISTHPRKKKGDQSWGRNPDGSFQLMTACEKCGTKYYGKENVQRFRSSDS